jgi:predicted extracellular nuclease
MPSLFPRRISLTGVMPVVLVAFLVVGVQLARAAGTISLTALGVPYSQDFDTLAITGTSNTVLPAGWDLSEVGSSSRVNGAYAASTGSDNAGDVYSFGATSSTERAYGTLLSGTLTPTIGASFTNNTSGLVTTLTISYVGEQWRLGTADRGPDRLDFQYSSDATSLATGTWTDVDALDFSSPVTTGAVGALDGNAAANQTLVQGAIPGLTLADGASLWIRWSDFNSSGADDGLAVDDFSLTPSFEESAPSVTGTNPADGATNVPVNSNITVTFSESVNVTGNWFTIVCASSGSHTAGVSGGPTSFTLDPSSDFAAGESCNVTVVGSQVSDQDTDDPPDTMSSNYVFSFGTVPPPVAIHSIQGAAHVSPIAGMSVIGVTGVVTAKRSNGFYFQEPDSDIDADTATSEGIFVFTSSAPTVQVGDALSVMGTVSEFRPGGASSTNLATTELTSPTIVVQSASNPLPAPTVIGTGGRVPPSTVIEDDATGDVETSGVFDPSSDGIDFYESLEGMRVQLNEARAVGPTSDFGSNREIPVVGDNGANASVFTPRGGLILQQTDTNPERVILNDLISGGPTLPSANVGDSFPGATVGVIDYSFGNFKLEVTTLGTLASGALAQESTTAATAGQLAVATFNVENLAPTDPPAKFATLAGLIVNNLKSPDVISVEEVQDNNGATNDGTVDATTTWNLLIAAITAAGGPTYQYAQIDPVNNADGGAPGGNIRQGFLYRSDRGLAFVSAPGGTSTSANSVDAGPHLHYSPGRIDPTNSAFNTSRKPLAGEFTFHGSRLFVIGNHFNSKGGDQPLFGHFQPPTRSSEVQRHQQAQIVNDFVDAILALDASANVIVLGDLNDFDYSDTLTILKGTPAVLSNHYSTLPLAQRYSYVFEGNSQALDHILGSTDITAKLVVLDPVHINAEFATQASDHDPLVARYCADATAPTLTATASPNTLWPPNHNYRNVTVTLTKSDDSGGTPTVAFVSATSNEPDNAPGNADGNTTNDIVKVTDTTFRLRAERDDTKTGRIYTITYRATDACNNTTTASATVTAPISQ